MAKPGYVWISTTTDCLIVFYFHVHEKGDTFYRELDILFHHKVPARKLTSTEGNSGQRRVSIRDTRGFREKRRRGWKCRRLEALCTGKATATERWSFRGEKDGPIPTEVSAYGLCWFVTSVTNVQLLVHLQNLRTIRGTNQITSTGRNGKPR